MSFKPVIQTDDTGRWYANDVRLATRAEAQAYACEFVARYPGVRAATVEASDEPVTHRYADDQLARVEAVTA